jgi:hypothetical protein
VFSVGYQTVQPSKAFFRIPSLSISLLKGLFNPVKFSELLNAFLNTSLFNGRSNFSPLVKALSTLEFQPD